jgi:nucleotidyltransferase substrate binding protein (TIGR01987 family)
LRQAEDIPSNELLRDGVIQRFEYSHELALKLMRRALETVYGDDVDKMAYNDVLRTAAERGLIENVDRWFEYRVARNKTSHTYDAATAAAVFACSRPFLVDAQEFLLRLNDLSDSIAA